MVGSDPFTGRGSGADAVSDGLAGVLGVRAVAGDREREPQHTQRGDLAGRQALLPFFAFVDAGHTIQRPLSDIDEGLVAQFIERKRQECAILTDLAEKLAEASAQELQDLERLTSSESIDLEEDEIVLLRRYGQRGGFTGSPIRGRADGSASRAVASRTLRSTAASRRCAASSTAPTAATGCRSQIRPSNMRLRGDAPNRNWLCRRTSRH